MSKFPWLEADAIFKCNQGCGTFERRNCYVYRGSLTCPVCRFIGTLRHLEIIDGKLKKECPACEGLGSCWACEGQDEYCTACDGTNYCGRCEGEGYILDAY